MYRYMFAATVLTVSFATAAVSAAPASVSGDGVSLSSLTVDWPARDLSFPPGPDVAAVNSNCVGCHSPGMVLTQPHLSQADWQAEVTKMRKVYKARIDDAAVPAIIKYLANLQTPK